MSSPENQQNRIDILFYYSMHEYSGILACFEHSNFFKVNLLASRDTRSRAPLNLQQKHSLQSSKTTKLTASRLLRSNYELFNHNNFNIRYWSWNYRGCWHQTCPPIDTHKGIWILLIPITRHGCPVLLFLVTTSLCQDWVICAPAAFLGCGSRFSGSLSGIEPLFPVTRWNHGRPLSYHRKLIGQKFEWTIASTRPCDSKSYYESSKSPKTLIFYLINTSLPKGRDFKHVLALELPQLYHVVKELSNKR